VKGSTKAPVQPNSKPSAPAGDGKDELTPEISDQLMDQIDNVYDWSRLLPVLRMIMRYYGKRNEVFKHGVKTLISNYILETRSLEELKLIESRSSFLEDYDVGRAISQQRATLRHRNARGGQGQGKGGVWDRAQPQAYQNYRAQPQAYPNYGAQSQAYQNYRAQSQAYKNYGAQPQAYPNYGAQSQAYKNYGAQSQAYKNYGAQSHAYPNYGATQGNRTSQAQASLNYDPTGQVQESQNTRQSRRDKSLMDNLGNVGMNIRNVGTNLSRNIKGDLNSFVAKRGVKTSSGVRNFTTRRKRIKKHATGDTVMRAVTKLLRKKQLDKIIRKYGPTNPRYKLEEKRRIVKSLEKNSKLAPKLQRVYRKACAHTPHPERLSPPRRRHIKPPLDYESGVQSQAGPWPLQQ
jgi:hypothetical protein